MIENNVIQVPGKLFNELGLEDNNSYVKAQTMKPDIAKEVEARLNMPWALEQIRRDPKGIEKAEVKK